MIRLPAQFLPTAILYALAAVASTPSAFAQTAAPLGVFDGQSDVGNPALSGSATFDPTHQQYTVSGAGANMWEGQDQFHFVWRQLSGDFSLTATAHFLKSEPPSHRKFALMARAGLSGDAPYVDAVVHGAGLTEIQFREAPAATTHEIRFPVDGPVRIRLVRQGAWFTMYAGAEGQPLQELGAYSIKLPDPVYVGLAVCSHNAAVLEPVAFSDVVFTQPAATQPTTQK